MGGSDLSPYEPKIKHLDLKNVTYFVLDEADRMLEGGFGDQMDEIAKHIQAERQTLFFSATWPTEVQELARNMCANEAIRVKIGQKDEGEGPATRGDIEQTVVVLDGSYEEMAAKKDKILHTHLRELLANSSHKVLVFVNMKSKSWELAEELQKEGFA